MGKAAQQNHGMGGMTDDLEKRVRRLTDEVVFYHAMDTRIGDRSFLERLEGRIVELVRDEVRRAERSRDRAAIVTPPPVDPATGGREMNLQDGLRLDGVRWVTV
jgi:hypothetical protein